MRKSTIKQLPLLFLFLPSLVATCVVYFYLNHSYSANDEQQLEASTQHVVARIASLVTEPLYNRRYSLVNQTLSQFVQQTQSDIHNIVIYNQDGQFITALNIDQALLHSTMGAFPKRTFFKEGAYYQAYGQIGGATIDGAAKLTTSVIGFVRVEMNAAPHRQNGVYHLMVLLLVILCATTISCGLWYHRYGHFYRQLQHLNGVIGELTKGAKHQPLDTDDEVIEISQLYGLINSLVSFYEKRLTMNHFELASGAHSIRGLKKQLQQLESECQSLRNHPSHENSTPLLTIIYQAVYQLLQTKLAFIDNCLINVNDGSQPEQSLSILDETIKQLNLLLNEINAVAELSAGQLKLHTETISSDQLVISISRLMAPKAHHKQLEFIIGQPAAPLDMDIDINQVQQVLISLLQRAIDSTQDGYIKWTVELIETNNRVGKVSFRIQDSGDGFDPVQYNMLVDDRIDPSLFHDDWIYQGLGLLVAKKTIEAMGGSFKIKSLSGLGAELCFELTTFVTDYSVHTGSDNIGGQILVYDPVMQSGELIFNLLTEQGIGAVLCHEASQVYEVLASEQVDCGVFCRPIDPVAQQVFDESILQIVALDNLEQCVFCSGPMAAVTLAKLALPASWKQASKPFVLADLTQYFDFEPYRRGNDAENANEEYICHSDKIEILAVDDNETNLKLLSVILRDYPVHLVSALSGREALVMSQKQVFDLILMDRQMPDMDGIETSQHIRQLVLNKHTPIIIFTANINAGEDQAMATNDINGCIEKPLNADKFANLMSTWCSKRWQAVCEGLLMVDS